MILYHFAKSPFARRVRLVLAHKSLDAELRDARAVPEHRKASDALFAGRTIPVLVDGDVAIGDSTAIATYLDRVRPAPPLWPTDPAEAGVALPVAALVDQALDALVDIGTRYFVLRDAPGWEAVMRDRVGRAQGCLDALAARATSSTIVPSGWCGADIWLFSAVEWLAGLPARKGENANIDNLLTLGWELPPALVRWNDAHRARADVRAVYG